MVWGKPNPALSATQCRFGKQRGQEILDATLAVLLEVGYDRLTFDAVATRARASKATLYRYWPSKVELIGDALAARPRAGQSVPDTGSLRGDLDALVEAATSVGSTHPLELMNAIGTAARRDDELAQVARDCILQPLVDDLSTILEQARSRGDFAPEADLRFVASVIPAMVMFHTCAAGLGGEPVAVLRRVIEQIVLPLASSAPASTPPAPAGRRRPAP